MAYVKVDGNRRITIFKQDELHVWAIFTDMLVTRDWKDSPPVPVIVPENINKDLEKQDDR